MEKEEMITLDKKVLIDIVEQYDDAYNLLPANLKSDLDFIDAKLRGMTIRTNARYESAKNTLYPEN